MTSPNDPEPPTPEPTPTVDPRWWRDVVAAEHPKNLPLLSLHLKAAAGSASSQKERDVLQLLADVTSAELVPDNWNDPYRPMMVIQGRRSAVPADLDQADLQLLDTVAELMDRDSDEPELRARINDVVWTYGVRSEAGQRLTDAIDAYSQIALGPESWFQDGREEWHRGLELTLRTRPPGHEQRQQIAQALQRRLSDATFHDGYFGVQLSTTIRKYKLVLKTDAGGVGDLSVREAANAASVGDLDLQRAWDEEATAWLAIANRRDDAFAAQARIGRSFADSAADARQGPSGRSMSAAHFVEQAIKVYTALPRAYRREHGLDDEITKLRQLLQADRDHILANMATLTSDPIDITSLVQGARAKVTGLGSLEALIALGDLHTWMPYQTAIEQAEETLADYPLSQLFGNETFSASGQKVAVMAGTVSTSPTSDTDAPHPNVWATAVRDRAHLSNMIVSARIIPALEVVTNQHRYNFENLYDLCRNNPWIPARHELRWARGLLHGLNHDFSSAACILVPEIEHLVRTMLKQNGVHTLHTAEDGTEIEKGLAALLDDDRCGEVLGPDLNFELRALLVDKAGPNLRNTLAHGLADDVDLLSEPPVYAWWLALRIATLPYACSQDAGSATETAAPQGAPSWTEGGFSASDDAADT